MAKGRDWRCGNHRHVSILSPLNFNKKDE